MLTLWRLLLPVLFPSWRFFETVEASPRVEWILLDINTKPLQDWQAFGPPPQRLSAAQMLGSLFWNARRNANLFMVSCAERMISEPNLHLHNEMLTRVWQDAKAHAPQNGFLQFRIRFVDWGAGQLLSDTRFLSELHIIRKGDLA
jgi:hypothetical protein